MNIPDPQVECWDYTFAQNSNDLVYVGIVNGDRNSVVSFTVNKMWRYIVVADTAEAVLSDIASFANAEDVENVTAEPYAIGDIIQNWRLVRYNGRKVCVYGCTDYSPDNCAAYPTGPIAPVTNGWLYYMVDQNQKPLMQSISNFEIPIISDHPNNLVELIAKGLDSDVDLIADVEYHIICANPLAVADKHPVIWYSGRAFPLLPILNLNPNLQPDGEDEVLQRQKP
jgi:hypothetical protein